MVLRAPLLGMPTGNDAPIHHVRIASIVMVTEMTNPDARRPEGRALLEGCTKRKVEWRVLFRTTS